MPKRTLPQPRSWLIDKHQHEFGWSGQPVDHWRSATSTSEKAFRNAARAQHEFMVAIRVAIKADSTSTTADLADDLGVTVDQLRRLMRGESQLLLVDMHRLAARLGIDIDTVVRQEPK